MLRRCHFYVLALLCMHNFPFIAGQTIRECWCTIGNRCDFSQVLCTPGNNCKNNTENIALGKRAFISSVYNSEGSIQLTDEERGRHGCLAVNGIINPVVKLQQDQKRTPNCIQTDIKDQSPSWTVYLDQNYLISNITIYAPAKLEWLLANVIVKVDNQSCYTFPEKVDISSTRQNIRCTTLLIGSTVSLQKTWNPMLNSSNVTLSVCEVQVWGCTKDYYGVNCDVPCKTEECNGSCDVETGICSGDCKPGFWGINCNQPCGECRVPCHRDGTCEDLNLLGSSIIDNFKQDLVSNQRRTVAISLSAVPLILTVVFIIIVRRKRKQKTSLTMKKSKFESFKVPVVTLDGEPILDDSIRDREQRFSVESQHIFRKVSSFAETSSDVKYKIAPWLDYEMFPRGSAEEPLIEHKGNESMCVQPPPAPTCTVSLVSEDKKNSYDDDNDQEKTESCLDISVMDSGVPSDEDISEQQNYSNEPTQEEPSVILNDYKMTLKPKRHSLVVYAHEHQKIKEETERIRDPEKSKFDSARNKPTL